MRQNLRQGHVHLLVHERNCRVIAEHMMQHRHIWMQWLRERLKGGVVIVLFLFDSVQRMCSPETSLPSPTCDGAAKPLCALIVGVGDCRVNIPDVSPADTNSVLHGKMRGYGERVSKGCCLVRRGLETVFKLRGRVDLAFC